MDRGLWRESANRVGCGVAVNVGFVEDVVDLAVHVGKSIEQRLSSPSPATGGGWSGRRRKLEAGCAAVGDAGD
jgi:hypothetical protein